MKTHIFLLIKPPPPKKKNQLQIHNSLEGTAENVSIIDIPILNFLCIYITANGTYMFATGEKIKRKL